MTVLDYLKAELRLHGLSPDHDRCERNGGFTKVCSLERTRGLPRVDYVYHHTTNELTTVRRLVMDDKFEDELYRAAVNEDDMTAAQRLRAAYAE